MRKLTFILALALTSFSAHAAPLAKEKENELRFATIAVLTYSGFIALTQRECLPSKPEPRLSSDWQKRNQRVLDSADAFAETIFAKHPADAGGRDASVAELSFLVNGASRQFFREHVGNQDPKAACTQILSKVKSGEFDTGPGRRLQPHAQALASWSASQKSASK